MSEVVTGDAVVLDVQIAQLPVRAISAIIDLTAIFFVYFFGLLLWAASLRQFDEALTVAFLIIFTVLAMIGYPVGIEMATRGRSLGKMVMGLRVVSDDGGPERFRQAVFRALASVIEIWMMLGSPAVICSLLSPKAKRIGDIFAGTIVVSERAPRIGPPPMMPPALAGWAASLQLSGLTPGQAEVARQFLSRANQLDPRLRDQMAYRIAADVVSHIAPPPPPGVPPQLILAAVLAERHRRELARLRPVAPAMAPAMAPAQWPAQTLTQQWPAQTPTQQWPTQAPTQQWPSQTPTQQWHQQWPQQQAPPAGAQPYPSAEQPAAEPKPAPSTEGFSPPS